MNSCTPAPTDTERAEAFRASIAALAAFLDTLPDSDHRRAAKEHLAAFALHAGRAVGFTLRPGADLPDLPEVVH